MEEMRKKVKQTLKNSPPIDWSDTKPPKQHAVYSMIKNLHAAAGTDADNTPKRPKNL